MSQKDQGISWGLIFEFITINRVDVDIDHRTWEDREWEVKLSVPQENGYTNLVVTSADLGLAMTEAYRRAKRIVDATKEDDDNG